MLYVEFSTDEDEDSYYRVLKLNYEDIEFYSPKIIDEEDVNEIDKDFVIDLIKQYLLDNDLPEEISL
jgi:hypothetical protein